MKIGQSLLDMDADGSDVAIESLRMHLTENFGKDQVQRDIGLGRQRYNISGVPFFVVGTESTKRPYGFSGAQKSETFLDLFQELADDE